MRRALAAAAASCVLAAAPVPARAQDDRVRELEAVRGEIDARRERLGAYEREERGLLETLEEIDRSILTLSAETKRARREEAAARRELDALAEREQALESARARTRAAMSARAVALYKAGEPGPLRVLFASSSLPELLARTQALRRLLEHDRRLLERYREEGAALEDTRVQLTAAAAVHERALATATARTRALAAERGGKHELLEGVHADRARERAALTELEAAARALEETLARLGSARGRGVAPADGDFESRRGDLPAPVDAPIVLGFGRMVDEEFQTETLHKGVDFDADAGTPVRAVAPGEVRFAGWFRGYGRMVILDHGGGYFTVSGHLEDLGVAVGDAVGEGDEIGTVGESGSLSGPRLYFEIRRGAQPQDPAMWLRAQGKR